MSWGLANDGKTRNDGKPVNGVFVATKLAFKAKSKTPGKDSSGALLQVQFESWEMLACYFPGASARDKDRVRAKARYFEACRDAASGTGARPLLIVGDLNTGNQTADRTEGGEKYTCSEHFDDLSQKDGLTDLWRRSNGADAREWTWFSSNKRNPFRLDHAFGHRPFVEFFRPTCRYDHRPREAGFSDHSAIVVATETDSDRT
jgi:exonuclease III